jgi:transposase
MEDKLPKSIDDISQEDWEKTPENVKRLVANLIGQIEQFATRVKRLERQYGEVEAQNQLLFEQVKQTSKNSSRPPSQDLSKGLKPKEKKQGKKKAGGQPGHEGHERPLYPIEQCQSVKDYYPERCIECGEPLAGNDSHPYRIQIVALHNGKMNSV